MKAFKKTISFMCLMVLVVPLLAQNYEQTAKLSPPTKESGAFYGHRVDVDGDYAIVGEVKGELDINEENPITNAGSAYIYEKQNGVWELKQKLVQEHRWFYDEFGRSVAIQGDYAIVGISKEDLDDPNDSSSNRSTQRGAAMIYKRDTEGIWQEHQLLIAGEGSSVSGEEFGYSIIMKDNLILVAAPYLNTWVNGEYYHDIGAIYVFEKDEETDMWYKTQKITASDPTGYDLFGYKIDYDEGTIVVSAAYHEATDADKNVGAAYIFEKNNDGVWEEMQKIEPSIQSDDMLFGYGLAITGNYIFVGAPEQDDGNTQFTGATYMFKRNEDGVWSEVQRLVVENQFFKDKYGEAIVAYENQVIITAGNKYYNNTLGQGAGYAYLYEINEENDTLELLETIRPSEENNVQTFGDYINYDGETIIVADVLDRGIDDGEFVFSAGAVYIFEPSATLDDSTFSNQKNKLSISPNPATDHLNINIQGAFIENMSILDMMGRVVYKESNPSFNDSYSINVSKLGKGTYLLNSKTNLGKVLSVKFIKQ